MEWSEFVTCFLYFRHTISVVHGIINASMLRVSRVSGTHCFQRVLSYLQAQNQEKLRKNRLLNTPAQDLITCESKVQVDVSQRSRLVGAYHLGKKSGNFGSKSNGTVAFRKIRWEIVDFLQRQSSFPFGTECGKFPYHLLNSFQFPVSHQPKTIGGNRIAKGKRHFVRLVC